MVVSQSVADMTTVGSMMTRRVQKTRPASLSGVMSPASGVYFLSLRTTWQEQQITLCDRLDITTDNPAAQVYTGNWLNTPRKEAHGGPSVKYTRHTAVAIEQEGHIAAINTPEWGVDQICGCFALVPTHPELIARCGGR